jgi:hypothetical protein
MPVRMSSPPVRSLSLLPRGWAGGLKGGWHKRFEFLLSNQKGLGGPVNCLSCNSTCSFTAVGETSTERCGAYVRNMVL